MSKTGTEALGGLLVAVTSAARKVDEALIALIDARAAHNAAADAVTKAACGGVPDAHRDHAPWRHVPIATVVWEGLECTRDRLTSRGFMTLGDVADGLADGSVGRVSTIGYRRIILLQALVDHHKGVDDDKRGGGDG